MLKLGNPVKVIIGRGESRKYLNQIKNMKLVIICSRHKKAEIEEMNKYESLLEWNKICWVIKDAEGCSLNKLRENYEIIKGKEVDRWISIGGGSTIDLAKILGFMHTNKINYQMLISIITKKTKEVTYKKTEHIAIPTTTGTGSEMTQFATIWNTEYKKKLSLNTKSIWPKIAIIDPDQGDSMPYEVVITTGLDAINQGIESISSKISTKESRDLAGQSIKLCIEGINEYIKGEKRTGIEKLAIGSMEAGIAISLTRTGLSHSISYPMTARLGISHGMACAFTMTEVLKHNLKSRDKRYSELSKVLTGGENIEDLIKIFEGLDKKLKLKEKIKYKIKDVENLLDLVGEMITPGRADNILVPASLEDIQAIIKRSWVGH